MLKTLNMQIVLICAGEKNHTEDPISRYTFVSYRKTVMFNIFFFCFYFQFFFQINAIYPPIEDFDNSDDVPITVKEYFKR